jgi:hypothetical protein
VADIPLVHLSKALSGIGNDPRLISVTAGENCPCDAGKLISERDCQHVAVKPLRCLLDPGPHSLPCRLWPPLEDNVCGLHEQCPHVFVSALGYLPQDGAVPGRAREVHLPEPREDQPGAGTVRRAAARPCRAESARHDPVREVRATQPLNRQSKRYAREGIDLSVSTLADQIGGCAVLLRPLYELIRAHVFAGERAHGDETPVPVLAKHETRKGRLWAYVRDDKPFAGPAPPAAVFFYSRDRTAQHPESHLRDYARILQAEAYAGFNRLYEADRKPGPITEASCWAHGCRKFFELADVTAKARGKLAVIAPLAFEAVKRIDAIFDIEREINGRSIDERLALRRIALGRKSWLFAGSDRGGERTAVMYTLIQTARLNDVDPQAWLADVLARINDHNIQKLDALLPWNWKTAAPKLAA